MSEESVNKDALPVYDWGAAPEGLFTKRQLDEKRLAAGEPRGLLPYSKTASGYLKLYLESEAVPKKPLSEKQQAAIAKMRAATEDKRRCSECGDLMYSVRDLTWHLCPDCYEKWRHESAKESVRKQARELLARDLVIFDTETTGLDDDARIVSIAIINQAGETTLNTLINPGMPIPAGATRIHGITDEMVGSAPSFADVYPAIFAALNGAIWCAYNTSFDTGMIRCECRRAELQMPAEAEDGYVDVMPMYAAWCGEWSDYFGDWRWQRLPGGTHSALDDALNTLALLRFLAAEASEGQTGDA